MLERGRISVGIDLAWGLASGRTGVAALAANGAYVASATLRTDDEIVAWVEAAGAGEALGVVAIDAPIVVPNLTGRRDCEQEIHAHFGRFDAGAHSTNRSKPSMDPPRAETLVRRLGLAFDPSSHERSGLAIEVYPHPAMVGLWDLDLILKYKHKAKYAFEFRREQFVLLLDHLNGIESLQLADAPRWSQIEEVVSAALTHGELNKVEDEVDGIVCAYLAWLWAERDARLRVFGDVHRGYIVAPHSPIHPARPHSERVAPRRTVRFEEPSEPDVTPIAAPPDFALDGPSAHWALTPGEATALERELRRLRQHS